jgi:hypothetical protein
MTFGFIGRWWRRRCREIDRKILWPQMLAGAKNENHLGVAMLMHVRIDLAWRFPAEWKDE